MSYIWPVLVRQLYDNLEYALCKFPWAILRIVTTAYPSYVKLLQDKIKSVDALHYGCGYLFINGAQMRNTHATTLKSMTQQIYRTIDIARLYI